ncbi:MAG: hypothetical protein M3R00_10085 [Pseudomonadota bacterium]|nr:hypothetical protein [Pseudomonadota bacterium]
MKEFMKQTIEYALANPAEACVAAASIAGIAALSYWRSKATLSFFQPRKTDLDIAYEQFVRVVEQQDDEMDEVQEALSQGIQATQVSIAMVRKKIVSAASGKISEISTEGDHPSSEIAGLCEKLSSYPELAKPVLSSTEIYRCIDAREAHHAELKLAIESFLESRQDTVVDEASTQISVA